MVVAKNEAHKNESPNYPTVVLALKISYGIILYISVPCDDEPKG